MPNGEYPQGYDIAPGAWYELQELTLAVQKDIADGQRESEAADRRIEKRNADMAYAADAKEREFLRVENRKDRALQANIALQDRALRLKLANIENQQRARETELRLATSPIDFVAYETYKRTLAEEGPIAPYAAPSSGADIRAMVQGITPATEGLLGKFGVTLPTTTGYTRAGFQDISPGEQQILSSFLRAGVSPQKGVTPVSVDPTEYFKEVQESFIPTLPKAGPTRYQY